MRKPRARAGRIQPKMALGVVCVWLGVAPLAHAQSASDSAAAQGLFDEAKALMTAGRAAEACPKLEESQRLDPGSGTLANLAKCYELTGRIASSWSTYLEAAVAAKKAGNVDRENGARALAAGLAGRVSKLLVSVPMDARVAGLEVSRDGSAVGQPQWGLAIPLDAGEHAVVARAPGYREWKTVAIVKGEGTTTQIDVPKLEPEEKAAADAPHSSSKGLGTQRIVALSAGGLGLVGVTIGTIFGVKAMSSHSDAEKDCSGSSCRTPQGVQAGNDARSAGNIATIGMIVGAVGLAGGVTLWFTAPKAKPSAELAVGPGSVDFKAAW